MNRKLKVLWIGDLVTPTGFSRVSHSILKHLGTRLEVKGLGVNYRGDPHNYKDLQIYPAMLGGDVYGLNRLREFVSWKPDFIFMINDAWILDKYLDAIKNVFRDSLPEIVTYIPVDAEEHDPDWYRHFDIVTVPVAYTQWGKNVILKAAPQLKDRIRIIPHGTDSDVFKPLNRSREEVKMELFNGTESLKDTFIYLSASRNQPRKRLDITIEAFSLMAVDKDNARLYMHCGVIDSAIDVVKLARRFGIEDKLIISSTTPGVQRVTEDKLNKIYNACDVGLNTSLGEGWSLTNIEHAVTKAPQIVPNHSACAELYNDCGLVIPAETRFTLDNIMTVGKLVRPEEVAYAMDKLYNDKELYNELAEAGYNKFTDPKYDWKVIAHQWLDLFQEVVK